MVEFAGFEARKSPFAPLGYEADVLDCEIIGTVPDDLDGAFVRLGGEWLYPPRYPDDAILMPEGYISAFYFGGGRVSYKGRWVRTRRFEANFAAGRQLFGRYRNPYTHDPSVAFLDDPTWGSPVNTAPVAHAGRLFALKEDGLPYAIDPATLATQGRWDFHGSWTGQTFTAHPRIDPLSGEMVAISYEASGLATNDVRVCTVGRDGRVSHEIRITQPYVSMIHDMAITQKHVILPMGGYVTDDEAMRAGKSHWRWDPSRASHIGIVPRRGRPEDVRWFTGPSRCMMHVLNAHDDGDKVVLDAPFFDSNFFWWLENVDGSQWDPSRAVCYLRRLTFDLSSDSDQWHEEILFERPVLDLAVVDPRVTSLPQRYGFMPYHDPNVVRPVSYEGDVIPWEVFANACIRYDFETGDHSVYNPGPGRSLAECVFVPRRGSTREGDGYLIGLANNFDEHCSELVVVDAQRMEVGELARVVLPFRAADQVHGTWVSRSTIDSGEQKQV